MKGDRILNCGHDAARLTSSRLILRYVLIRSLVQQAVELFSKLLT